MSLSPLYVEGNSIKDSSGTTVILRGCSLIDIGDITKSRPGGIIGDIDRITKDFPEINFIRLPIYPKPAPNHNSSWPYTEYDKENYWQKVLKPALDYTIQKNCYALVDWHIVDFVDHWKDRTHTFWGFIAKKLIDYPNALLELFCEPIKLAGRKDWAGFQPTAQEWVNTIRSTGNTNIVIVGGPIWCQMIGDSNENPILSNNIAYCTHYYSCADHKFLQTQARKAAEKHPVLVTEWGFESNDEKFGEIFKNFATELELGWVAWVADNSWGPPLYNKDWTLNAYGIFLKNWLANSK